MLTHREVGEVERRFKERGWSTGLLKPRPAGKHTRKRIKPRHEVETEFENLKQETEKLDFSDSVWYKDCVEKEVSAQSNPDVTQKESIMSKSVEERVADLEAGQKQILDSLNDLKAKMASSPADTTKAGAPGFMAFMKTNWKKVLGGSLGAAAAGYGAYRFVNRDKGGEVPNAV